MHRPPDAFPGRLTSTPRVEGWPLALVGLLIASSLVLTGWVQYQKLTAPEPPAVIGVLDSRQLHFRDARDGSVEVIDARTGEMLEPIVGEAGFARGVLRGLAQARLRQGGTAEQPFELRAEAAGALRLIDPVTGRAVDLTVFGPTNAIVFQTYLNLRQAHFPEKRQ